jgi:predicted ATPase/DNA-binding SARP family transcriptional activator/DNA-binding CsgD family transcriptional regulator
VRVWLLGGFRVSVGPRIIEGGAWRLRKAAALVKLLALTPRHRLHREQAMDALWPDLGRKAASNNLRQALYAARRALDRDAGSKYLASEEESLVLCPGGDLRVDSEGFEEAAKAARRSGDPAAYRAAIELYGGELLPEDRYEEWVETRREGLRQLYLTLLVEMSELYEERGEYGSAVQVLRRAVAEETTLEEAHAGLMRLYALSDRGAEAMAQYERLREALSARLGTEPSATTRGLRDEIAAGEFRPSRRVPASPPPWEPTGLDRHNLPAPRTSFVGREREMLEQKRALAMTRLLTLTGAGGSGKTRLALEVARGLVGAYSDGVWLVELAPLSEPGLVAQEVAGAVGGKERPDQPLSDTLADLLRDKELLLVLDNCEHVVVPAARLVDGLLASCPRLKVLATSREMLGVAGEVNRPVPPLSVPTATDGAYRGGPTVEELVRCEAVMLFVDRARLRLPDFELTEENAGAVVRVCSKLDGIPLAIELATARLGSLAVEQVAQRLEISFDLLKGQSRTAEARQRTLRATLDWSHDLLSEAERALFGRLSVFAGGWTLKAAETVCSGAGIEEGEILDLLGGLVDKSLVVAGESTIGAVRYRMLEPVRQYAQERLKGSGEAEAIRHRHAAFFLALAEEAERGLTGPQQKGNLERLDAEHGNLRGALSWALERGEAELGLRLGGALRRFWGIRSYISEGRGWLGEALAMNGPASGPVRAKALEGEGWLAFLQGDYERARASYEKGLDLHRGAGNERGIADALYFLGMVLSRQGNHERAATLLDESLVMFRRLGDDQFVASVLDALGSLASARGDVARALALYEEAVALSRKVGNTQKVATSLGNLGHTTLVYGDHRRATALLEESLVLFRDIEDSLDVAICLTNLGLAVLARGDHRRAATLLEESLSIARKVRSDRVIIDCLEAMVGVAGMRDQDHRAARLWGAAQALREDIGAPLGDDDRTLLEPYLAAVRSRLDEEAWDAALAEGKDMGPEEAVEYALSEDGGATFASAAPDRPLVHEQPLALTRREEEVATLVGRGLTNRRIAEELFLSERTVHRHVSSVLKKLGVASREHVASRLADRRPSNID